MDKSPETGRGLSELVSRDCNHLRTNLAAFIDQYYNGTRLHSALGYQPPNEFERGLASGPPSGVARMQFFRPAQESKPGEVPS